MTIRAVIFDLDQTLLDRNASLSAFLLLQTSGMLKPDLQDPDGFVSRFVELDDNGRVWKDVVYRKLIEEFDLETWSMEELLAVYETRFCDFCVPRSDAEQAIRELSPNYRLGLISNGKTPFQERNFQALGFSESFGSVLVSEAVGVRKPDPVIFRMGCSELGVRPEEAVYVGDNPTADIKGAQEAGLKAVFLTTDLNPTCDHADATCSNLSKLPEIIGKL